MQHAVLVELCPQAQEQALALIIGQARRGSDIEQQLYTGFAAVNMLAARSTAPAEPKHQL